MSYSTRFYYFLSDIELKIKYPLRLLSFLIHKYCYAFIQDNCNKYDTEIIGKLNEFLKGKYEKDLPKSDKERQYIINQVKAVFMTLIDEGYYYLINQINLPEYIIPCIESLSNSIKELREKTFSKWISYLEESGNGFLIPIVRSYGDDFFSGRTKGLFLKYFKKYKRRINNYKKLKFEFYNYNYDYIELCSKKLNHTEAFNISYRDYKRYKEGFKIGLIKLNEKILLLKLFRYKKKYTWRDIYFRIYLIFLKLKGE